MKNPPLNVSRKMKKTPVGEIPVEWSVVAINKFAALKTGGTPSRACQGDYYNGTIPWVKTGDLNNGDIFRTEEKISSLALAETSCSTIPANSVLVAMYGGFKQIGRTGLLKMAAATNQALCAILHDESKVRSKFLQYWLNFRVGAWRKIAGSSRKDPNITKYDVGSLSVVVPSLVEQCKIENTFYSWDCAIKQTEALVEAKRRFKAGLMQQLLTGKRRFPTFGKKKGEGWTRYHLGDLFDERNETGRGDLPLLSITADRGIVNRDDLEKKDTSNADKSKYLRIAPGDIGYNTMRMWQGVSALSDLEGIVSPAYTVCIPKAGKIDGRFAAYLFKYQPVVHDFWRYS